MPEKLAQKNHNIPVKPDLALPAEWLLCQQTSSVSTGKEIMAVKSIDPDLSSPIGNMNMRFLSSVPCRGMSVGRFRAALGRLQKQAGLSAHGLREEVFNIGRACSGSHLPQLSRTENFSTDRRHGAPALRLGASPAHRRKLAAALENGGLMLSRRSFR